MNWPWDSPSGEWLWYLSSLTEHQEKWANADLVTLASLCQTLAEMYLGSCCLAWDGDWVGIKCTAFPHQPTQTSALPPHHHFAQHQTTKLACSPAPMAIRRINDPPSTLAVPYCPGMAGAGNRESRGRRTRRGKGLVGQDDKVLHRSGIKMDRYSCNIWMFTAFMQVLFHPTKGLYH